MPKLRALIVKQLSGRARVSICEEDEIRCCALCNVHLKLVLMSVVQEAAHKGLPFALRFSASSLFRALSDVSGEDYREAGLALQSIDDLFKR